MDQKSAVLEPRTGQFSILRLGGQDQGLDLRGKAKDFKMCPGGRARGQRRPQGLHLC